MNITPHAPTIPIPTVVNPPTDALRRENSQREVIAQPAAAQQSAAEKGVASERERARTPAQNNEQIDFENIRKQAELANSTISEHQEESSQHPDQQQEKSQAQNSSAKNDRDSATEGDEEKHNKQEHKSDNVDGLDYEQQQIVKELQQRDREVRSHELAHSTAGGSTTGAPSFSFEVGPDGKKYAVEGEVSVDLSPVKGNPQATIVKMQKVYNAALAPANPSIQDTRVANSAAQLIAQAQSEILALKLEDPNKEKDLNRVISERASFSGLEEGGESSSDFDRQINQTLKAQEYIAPTRTLEVDQRALRIENFYGNITQAYEKPSRSQFELSA